ncbi:MAG: FCD domain-containing protein [Novosphingobium sp.]|nr:FCD domain-containing protein [Novosphingobium sp.]
MPLQTHSNDKLDAALSVYEKLKADIIAGALPPDQKLKIEVLRDRYACSGSPLREALSRLTAESLVSQENQRGFRVAAISSDDLRELIRMRKLIDVMALNETMQQGDAAWEEGIILAHHRLTRAPSEISRDNRRDMTWIRSHGEFHRALLAACPSYYLRNFSSQLFDSCERYREILSRVDVLYPRDLAGEHKAIMDAVLARDFDRAPKLICEHMDNSANLVLRTLDA